MFSSFLQTLTVINKNDKRTQNANYKQKFVNPSHSKLLQSLYALQYSINCYKTVVKIVRVTGCRFYRFFISRHMIQMNAVTRKNWTQRMKNTLIRQNGCSLNRLTV